MGSRCRVEDLPPSLRRQVEAQIAREDARRAEAGQDKPATAPTMPRASHTARRRSGEQTEQEVADLLTGLGCRIVATQHAVTLAAGPRYTADLLARGADGRLYLVEAKGYRHASVQRSRLAFLSAVRETGMGGLWAERRKAGQGRPDHWRVEVYNFERGQRYF